MSRAIFNHHCQGRNKTATQFITSLYSLAENSEYGELKDDLRLYRSWNPRSVTVLALLNGPKLTLKKTKSLVRQREAVQEQQSLLQHSQEVDKLIDFLHKTSPFKGEGSQRG